MLCEIGDKLVEKCKDKRIKKEITKFNKIFKELDEDRKKAVEKLIANAAFMAITLEDLQEKINEKGCIEEYKNGANQCGYKESSEIKVYNSLIKNYNTTVKQLLDQLPKNDKNLQDDFDVFLSKN